MALSVDKVRHEMLRGILVPRHMVNKALQTTFAKLDARETKFFSHKGIVTQTREVDDHGTQLAAADQIFTLAGLYAREREERPSTPGVALEIDPNTGVIRLVVGAPPALEEPPTLVELPAPFECSPAEQSVAPLPTKTQALDSVWKIVSDEIVD